MGNESRQKKKLRYAGVLGIHSALEDICVQYPVLGQDIVKRFYPVLYPIALVDIIVCEKTFEDFQSVEEPVLKLISAGIGSPKIIADTLGLSENYITRIVNLFLGNGMVELTGAQMKLTKIGFESLQLHQKIDTIHSGQTVQIDALNGNMLRLENFVEKEVFIDKEKSSGKLMNYTHMSGIDAADIEAKILGKNTYDYIKKSSGIINSNAEKIEKTEFKELKYASAFYMELTYSDEPIIWSRRYNADYRAEVSERYEWQPFAVTDERTREFFRFGDKISRYEKEQYEYIKQMNNILFEKQKDKFENDVEDYHNNIFAAIESILPLDKDNTVVEYGNSERPTIVYLNSDSVIKYKNTFVDVLYCLDCWEKYISTSGQLFGHMIEIRSENKEVLNLAEGISNFINQGKGFVERKKRKKKLKEYFIDELKDIKDEINANNLIEKLGVLLEEYND